MLVALMAVSVVDVAGASSGVPVTVMYTGTYHRLYSVTADPAGYHLKPYRTFRPVRRRG